MELTGWLARCPLIAILRGVKPDEVLAIGEALERQGIAIVEVPLNSPQPMESITRLAREFGERLLIGAGTVMTSAQVAEIARAGGRLVVTPHASAVVMRAAKELVSAKGLGDANPVASNDTAQGRAKNRRVELTLASS